MSPRGMQALHDREGPSRNDAPKMVFSRPQEHRQRQRVPLFLLSAFPKTVHFPMR